MYFKQYISFFLIVLLTILCIKDWVTVVQFKANRSFVAEYLCVNKNNPDMKCNGKCFLMKKLKQSKEHSQSPQSKEELKQVYYTLTTCISLPLSLSATLTDHSISVITSALCAIQLIPTSPPPEMLV